jgi:hypothetical protein
MTEKDKEINIINDKMVKLYGKILKLKHKLNLCFNCPYDEPKDKEGDPKTA